MKIQFIYMRIAGGLMNYFYHSFVVYKYHIMMIKIQNDDEYIN